MKLMHWMRQETSGLAFTTLEMVAEEERQGHQVCVREPSGNILCGTTFDEWDVDLIHSQFPIQQYGRRRPTFLWCHGEPLSSVGNGVSMKAIVDMAPLCDAFICMRKEEYAYWNTIKRTYLVPKGINLDTFKPLPSTSVQKLSGAPSVLYMEHWRGQRNPLPLVVAMQKVWREYPDARLHLYNVKDKKMLDTFSALIKEAKLWPYVRSLQGPVKPSEVNELLNKVDIVVSCLHPLYARSIEAFGANRAFLCPGYRDPEYPFLCDLDPDSMADAIIKIWNEGCGKFDFRDWAVKKHNITDMVAQSVKIYERFL
jgi:glycosyltransferase involved in cell wall biosynthesis